MSYAKGFSCATEKLVDVDFNLLNTKYYVGWREHRNIDNIDIKDVLSNTGLAKEDKDGILRPKFAAVLLFALYPNDLTQYKCAIRVLQYEGSLEKIRETPNLIGNPETIDGPVIEQIKKTHDYVLQLLRTGISMPASGFKTKYSIPERAIKEAITNAVIHRDYYTKRDIEVKIFEDRVEIESPGLLPANITLNNIGIVRAEKYRNDLLIKQLREFPNPPNLDQNEGVRAMRAEMQRCKLYEPKFLTYPDLKDSFRVVLFNVSRPSEWDKVNNYLNNQQEYITNEDVRRITGNPDTSKVSRLLSVWTKHGFLIKVETGAKKTSRYILPRTALDYESFFLHRSNLPDKTKKEFAKFISDLSKGSII